MKRPWQIWMLYALGLLVVVVAFAWLTVRALELDRAESLARRQAELEEDVTATLWRMDAILTPLLAEEAARPSGEYQAILAPERLPGMPAPQAAELSPLLTHRSEFVMLHFETRANGQTSSPQCPVGAIRERAIQSGVSTEIIDMAAVRLADLHSALSFPMLLAQCPSPSQSTNLTASPTNQQWFGSQLLFNDAQPLESPTNSPAPPAQFGGYSQFSQQTVAPNAAPDADGNSVQTNNTVESGRLTRPQSRAGSDLAKRDAALQSYAQKAFEEQRGNVKGSMPVSLRIAEGPSRPLWVGDRLLVARQAQIGGETVVQGCWLDWPRLNQRLQAEAADLLPSVDLIPVPATGPIKLSRLLAALPVQLVVPPPVPQPAGWTPIRVSLLASWACLLVAAGAAALMLHSIVTLSERRGAFVSAVTHELRTPLTTFRMYAEMLADGMVPDETQRRNYLETLRREADRLAHLVENVLQYARLERGRPGKRREQISLANLIDRCQSRLVDRAAQAEMKLDVQLSNGDRDVIVATDGAAVEQILFNLVDNACKYAANATDRRIHVSLKAHPREVQLSVRDHGPGISDSARKTLFRPFSKSVQEAASTAPGVGLGLALSRRLAAELGGRLELVSPSEGGAAFVLTLPRCATSLKSPSPTPRARSA